MKRMDWEKLYSPVPRDFHEALHSAVDKIRAEKPTGRKRLWILVAAIVLMLATGTTVAMMQYYSVRQYQAGGEPSAEFEARIVAIEGVFENEYLTVMVGDTVFDGTEMALALNLASKDVQKPVYLSPALKAVCQGRELELDEMGMRGDFMSGFLFPNLVEDGLDGMYGFDVTLFEEEAPTAPVEWEFTLRVLAPNWPVKNSDEQLNGDGTDPTMEEYMQQFRDAYDRQEILATYGDSMVEYSLGVRPPEGMVEEEFQSLRLYQRLIESGAFTLVDTIQCSFTTPVPAS
jgi:hypothetical protein